jgi:hypothetical protein
MRMTVSTKFENFPGEVRNSYAFGCNLRNLRDDLLENVFGTDSFGIGFQV